MSEQPTCPKCGQYDFECICKEGIVSDRELMLEIADQWAENMDSMGEMAALEVACEMNGKDSEWYFNNMHLIQPIKQ